ncbi:PAS domain S-box protein [Haloarcula onubensis]|uniref:PAS domain S-box protein n=1 Tax=Haloarcula onubensis TaxID=2950539 RepID=A0ABU2FL96_9EURY|nr:PAS domain S-box protein [Halomicroarcula sp. S3CR25-11]MDS0281513.1 PAS domain S-box protein [Halomicroarcula sp. S3CR25-11]
MSDPSSPAPTVLAVDVGTAVTDALTDRALDVQTVEDGAAALDGLDERPVDCVLTAAETASLTGVELAAVVTDQFALPTVVVGDVPSVLADAAGVTAVCSPTDPGGVADVVLRAVGTSESTALSEATIDALEALYELDHAGSVEAWLESVARIGCRRLGLPYGFVTRIEDGTQHVVAAVGDSDQLQAGASAPLSDAYCEHTIQSDDIVGFSDVRDVEWVSDDAVDRFGLSCYLGGRIELEGLYGTICFADERARSRSFTAEERTFVKLLTQWVRYELSQRERRAELRLKDRVMDEAAMGITVSDPDRADNPLVYVNEGFERVTGYDREAAIGRNCRFLQGENTDPETVREIREAIDAGESIITELRNYRPDGTEFWCRLQVHPVREDGEVVNFVGFQRDVTAEKEREQELVAYETAVNTAADPICRLDDEGRFRMVSDAVCALTGYDREALLGAPLATLLSDADAERTLRRVEEAAASDGAEVPSLTVGMERRDGSTVPAEARVALLTEDGDHRGTVLVARDVSDRRAHERTLTELHDVSRSLLGVERSTAVSETIAAAADEILDIEAVGVYRFDERANRLRPEGVPEATRDLVGEPPTFGPGDGIAWAVFVDGERRMYDDVTTDDDVYDQATPVRSELFIPIGDYGVLICGSTDAGAYDQRTAELADLLAATAQAAYERVERDRRLRRRERELREQNRRLERLDAVNDRIRRISHDLVGATTREEIAALVCEGLAAIDSYRLVCVGEFDHVDGRVNVNATAGAESGYLDAVSLGPGSAEPTVGAATGTEPVVHNTVADGLRSGEWQRAALNRDYRATASFPLRHNGVPYGALSVYANTAEAFDEETRDVLADFAATVAYSMAAVEQRQALLSDQQVQLVFGMAAQPTAVFAFAEALDAPVTVRRVVPRSDGGSLVYGIADGVPAVTVETCGRDSHGLDVVRATDTDEGARFELHVTGPSLGEPVADHGGTFEELHVEAGRGRLVVTFPSAKLVSEFTRLLTTQYDGVELLARREHGDGGSGAATAGFTDRQREALVVAHERGFYDWPRESTAEEVADSLGIAAPTFLEHLRRAEAKLVQRTVEHGDIGAQ